MKLTSLLLLAGTLLAAGAPPEEDRRAILAMAGQFDVSFEFIETVAIAPDYKPLSIPYHEDAFETVVVAEDTPNRIALQHLLVVEAGPRKQVIKHWTQVWTWEDTHILDYSGSEDAPKWTRKVVSKEEAAGKWSQLVTSIDDTPRYESLGKWTHRFGESSWTSGPTRRPLPRREYTKRKDYDYLLGTNRHTITANGWVHTQDNRKVVDRGGKQVVLSYETGLNQYVKTDSPLSQEAIAWWEKSSPFWNNVRAFWLDAVQKEGPQFSYSSEQGGVPLAAKFKELEKSSPDAAKISESLTPYISLPR
ncbi:hypothetical protein OVA24_18130 [Luteolibacter sp. SL250]|uniref:DUF6607 family protein n=1 Tax=Luteolibacter sp. SL250 TaxID=2995170 RepID=UPI002270A882|nr:DUF6607 family protein [Luteolibacter sp. SL250]WAC19148.1 hypothetical protein OVA24_18130 [Luteolibacter sp. SL250]